MRRNGGIADRLKRMLFDRRRKEGRTPERAPGRTRAEALPEPPIDYLWREPRSAREVFDDRPFRPQDDSRTG